MSPDIFYLLGCKSNLSQGLGINWLSCAIRFKPFVGMVVQFVSSFICPCRTVGALLVSNSIWHRTWLPTFYVSNFIVDIE